jgi:hypothetical protein
MPQLSQPPVDRRSGADRRRASDDGDVVVRATDPIAAWNLLVPDALLDVRCLDPWRQIVQQSLADEHEGAHDDAGRAWDGAVVWDLKGVDPTGRLPAAGGEDVLGYHRDLGQLTDFTFAQELVSVEGSRGPIVEAHVRTTARRGDRTLDIPTLIVFELSCLRVRRVTEIPGDITAWDAFWRG